MTQRTPIPVHDTREQLQPERIDYLDGWRGLAILLVLQGHFLPESMIDSDTLGVDIFFGLSGLLMSRILYTRRTPLTTFYKRRTSRILPAFILFVATVYGLSAWRGSGRTWTEVLSTLFFLRTYLPTQPDIWNTGLPIGHLWSLNVEEHCYFFLGLLTLVAFVRGREARVLACAGGVSMALYIVYTEMPSMRGTSFEIRTEVAASFLLLSAAYFQVRDRIAPYVRSWMPLATFSLACTAYSPGARWWMVAGVAPLALAFTVNHLGEAPRLVRRLLAAKAVRMLGIWSYSIYLWQQPFFDQQFGLSTGVALAGALLTGVASFYLWENPWRTWINSK